MEFSVLFWNIWLENQVAGPNRSKKLLNTLKDVINNYKPDCIGLNEVLRGKNETSPFVTDFFKNLGYKYVHFASFGPHSEKWDIGNAVCSKYPLKTVKNIVLGRNIIAERKGFFGHLNKAITAEVSLTNKVTIKLIAVHPIYLDTHNFIEHYRHMKSLANFLEQDKNLGNTIVGGDFNEPFHMPRSMKKNFYHKTGTFINRTWRNNASKRAFIRFNLDRVMWAKEGSLELKKFEVIRNDISDHRPLYSLFYIPPSATKTGAMV